MYRSVRARRFWLIAGLVLVAIVPVLMSQTTGPGGTTRLAVARDTVDVPAIRSHMWSVFGTITAPAVNSDPQWRTWQRACTAYQHCLTTEGFQLPLELLSSLPTFQKMTVKDLEKAGADAALVLPPEEWKILSTFPPEVIYFNAPAYAHVTRQFHYATGDTAVPPCLTPLDFVLAKGGPLLDLYNKFDECTQPGDLPNGLADRAIPEFPSDAIAIKTAWEVVTAKNSALTVWNVESGTSHTVQISTAGASEKGGHACPDLKAGQAVPLDCLYHFRLGSAAASLRARPFRKDVQESDFAVLVAMHVMTKELPDWTWGTFWWHDRPDVGAFAAQRPAAVGGVWRNYLMNATFSQSTPYSYGGGFNSCYNPYLEGKLADPGSTSCVRCHRMAAKLGDIFSPKRPVSASDVYFKDRIKTDYSWTAARGVDRVFDKAIYGDDAPIH